MTTSPYIPGNGPLGPRLMVIKECPTLDEVRAEKLLAGSGGKQITNVLSEAGINANSVWITTVSKYHIPPSSRDKKLPIQVRAQQAGVDLGQQLIELQNEVNSVKPNCILALGKSALWALTGNININDYRGSIIRGMGRKVVGTFNPEQLLNSPDVEFKGYFNRQLMVLDSNRALKESESPELNLPARLLRIAKNSSDVYDFFRRNAHLTKPAVDIEAMLCMPVCVGIAFTPNEGLTIPLWNHFKVSKHIPDSDLATMWWYLAEALARLEVVGQNFKYDQDKIRRFGFIVKKLVSDTMIKSFAINPEIPKGLALQTSIWTREPFYKNEGMYEGEVEDLFLGCARDACVTKEIDLKMDEYLDKLGQRPFYENFLMPLHELYLGIENTGFRVDPEARDRLLAKYIKWDEQVGYDLFRLIGENINVNSWQQVGVLLQDVYKLPVKLNKNENVATNEEALTALLNHPKVNDEVQRKVIDLILLKRRITKSIGTYMMAMPDYDGRMKTTYFICLDTGRTSTGMQDPPIRPEVEVLNFDGKKKKKTLGIAFQTMTKHGDVGADIREQYIPDDGEIFIQADSSQAEARVIFVLAEDFEALELIDKIDYHALTATWFFGLNKELHDYDKKKLGYEHPIRFCGKTLRHAGHLGASHKRAATEVNTQARKYNINITITDLIAKNALETFHKKQPKIRQNFHNGIQEKLRSDRRYLTAGLPYGIDSICGGKRQFFERWGDELFRQAYSYIPQRTVSDNTKCAALRIKKEFPPIKIIMESHDALLFSVPEKEACAIIPVIKREMERPISFANCSLGKGDLVIPCEIEVGYNYSDLNKFKGVIPERISNVISTAV